MMRLPRRVSCPHVVLQEIPERGAAHIVCLRAFPCPGIALDNGYCDIHQAGHEIMVIGRDFGYRALAVNSVLELGNGKEFWEALAVVASDRLAGQVRVAVQKVLREQGVS